MFWPQEGHRQALYKNINKTLRIQEGNVTRQISGINLRKYLLHKNQNVVIAQVDSMKKRHKCALQNFDNQK
jgi:hypothetical protein